MISDDGNGVAWRLNGSSVVDDCCPVAQHTVHAAWSGASGQQGSVLPACETRAVQTPRLTVKNSTASSPLAKKRRRRDICTILARVSSEGNRGPMSRGNVKTKCHFNRGGSKDAAFAEQIPFAMRIGLRIRVLSKCVEKPKKTTEMWMAGRQGVVRPVLRNPNKRPAF